MTIRFSKGLITLDFTFTAVGYAQGTASIRIMDDEPAFYQNPELPLDVDGNGVVAPIDALRILNELNVNGGARALNPSIEPLGDSYFDTNGDYQLTPLDALVVINFLARQPVSTQPAENEDEDSPWSSDWVKHRQHDRNAHIGLTKPDHRGQWHRRVVLEGRLLDRH
ncbi:MAG: dockerin type I domain-containing protein [Pirellulaceae bacterium]